MTIIRSSRKNSLYRTNLSKASMSGFYLLSVASVLMGFFMVAVLNMATPLIFFKGIWGFWLGVGPGEIFTSTLLLLAVIVFMTGVPVLILHLAGRPVAEYIRSLKAGVEIPEDLAERGRRRLINLPFYLALTLIILWGIAPDVAAGTFIFLGYLDMKTGFSISGRASLMALISSGVCFFLVSLK